MQIRNEELGFNAVPFYFLLCVGLEAVRSTGLCTGNLSNSNKQSRMRRSIRHSLGVVRV